MTWTSIPHGDMAKALNHLHSEVVFNAVRNMAERPDLTANELHELLSIIETEVACLLAAESTTCTYEPSEYGDGHLWYTCSECGGHVSADYDAPSYCPHCGRKIEREDSDEAGE